jgi:hypothetical protein
VVLRSHPGRNNALGQAHSPAIELRLKIARLAGLFCPTRAGVAPPKPFLLALAQKRTVYKLGNLYGYSSYHLSQRIRPYQTSS